MAAVLVTGGSGFLGQRAVAALESRGLPVVSPSRAQLDVTDGHSLERFIHENAIDVIVHLAASVDRRQDQSAHAAQWRDTFGVGRTVLLAAGRAGVRLVVAAGTMDEVGDESGVVGPDVEPSPRGTYGLCKSLVLDVARFAVRTYGLQVEWFRPTTVYGPAQVGPMVVPSAFEAAASGRVHLAEFTTGEQLRDFVYVDDVADWVSRAAALPGRRGGVTIHHVGSASPIAVREVLHRIAALADTEFTFRAIPRRPDEPDLVTVPHYHDPRHPLSDWRPHTALDHGLARTWAWWRKGLVDAGQLAALAEERRHRLTACSPLPGQLNTTVLRP